MNSDDGARHPAGRQGAPEGESSDSAVPLAAAAPTLGRMSRRNDAFPERRPPDDSSQTAPVTAEAAALRDAQSISARVAADEAAADAERQRLLHQLLPVLDARIDPVIQVRPDEQLHAERRAALLERREGGRPSGGTLYLTSGRLIHVGSERIEEIALDRIKDMAVSMERLLLIELTDGSDLAVEVDQPRLLRVQVSAARAVMRGRKV